MLIFDLDGTLCDSNDIWEDTDRAFLTRRGLVPTEEYAYTVGHSIFPVAAQFTKDYYKLDVSCEDIMAEWISLAQEGYHHVPLKPGVASFLAQCHAKGEPMALLTACVPALCRTVLTRHNLTHYFSQIIFALELGLEKRDPAVYHKACQLLDVPPEVCTFFEDAPSNCAAAKSVGMKVVGVHDKFYGTYAETMQATCDRYIHSFEELL